MTNFLSYFIRAQANDPPEVDPNRDGAFNWTNLWTDLPQMISVAITVVGVVVVIFLILGGVQYVTAGGNEESVKKAKRTITNAVIGLVVVLLSFAIMQGIKSVIQGQ